MTLSDLGWISQIFSDTKRRAVCLRQLSFLLVYKQAVIDGGAAVIYAQTLNALFVEVL